MKLSIEGGSGRTGRQLQIGRQGLARVIKCGYSLTIWQRDQAGGLETKVHTCGGPAKVVIVLEKVAEASGGEIFGVTVISAPNVVGRVRGCPSDAVGEALWVGDRSVNSPPSDSRWLDPHWAGLLRFRAHTDTATSRRRGFSRSKSRRYGQNRNTADYPG